MNKQLNLSAKKYNFLQKLQINSFVDAIDQNRWKVAQIVEFKNIGHKHTIRLHFDGFPNNWDQYFDLPASTKLAPFRRFTLPYTGPLESHRTIHRPSPSLNFEEPLANLKKLYKQDKQKLKPDFIIQVYRGALFILMDTLLTMPDKVKQEQQVQIQKFIEAYIETGIHILKYSLEKINEISKQNINEPNVIYVNPIYSLISSIPEILFNFNSLVSTRQKRIKFFGQSQMQIQQNRKKYRAYLKNKQIVQICRSILQYQNPPYRGFSWNIRKQALVLLAGLEQQPQFPKITDNRQIPEALDILSYLKIKQVFSQQFIQNIHIDLVMTLVMSGNFQGKLKSLAELKKFCENTFYKRQILKEKILSPQMLNALTDNATFNGQIFKRSLPLFQAAAKYDLINDQILKRIVNLHKDKHQLQVKSYYSTLADFGQILNQKKTIQLFQEIKNFPITIDTIHLIKNYTQNVIKRHPYFKKKYMEPQTGFGLVYLWQIIKQNNSYEIVNAAISAFAALSSDAYYRQIIEKYIIECFSNIKAGKNVQSSLKIIHFCLNKNKDIVSIIQNIDKQFSIIDTVIKSLIQAQQISSTTIQSIFQFIQQVNQVARKKITVNHIRDLWKLKQCQKSLLKFMRKSASFKMQKQKPHEKITNKKLSQLQIHQIVSKIFLNKVLMDNYVNCDEQLYKTIDELLISYNHRSRFIQYNFKHSIKCISHHQLFGLELYLQIGSNCKDQIIVNKCFKRFTQYYLRPFATKSISSNKNDKVGLWLLCADKLTKYFEQNPKKYSAYAILFEEIKGRMLSINILDPTQATFTVQIKGTNNRKIITAPHCYSLWKLRQIIDQEFKLNKTNFGMYMVDQKVSFDMDREEDFSVLFLNASRDPTDIAVIVTQAKEPHPHFVAIEEFKGNFTNIYAQKIYQNLNLIKNLDIQLIALNLLLELPLIKNIQSRALKLELGAQLSWDQILDTECRTRLSYQIHILNKVKQSGLKWIMDFIKKGGVEHIEKILRQRSSNKVTLAAKDYQFLIQLLQFFNQVIQFYRMHQPNLPFNESSIIQIMRFSNQQKINISLVKQQAFVEYFYLTFNTLKEIVTHYPNMEVKRILSNPHIDQVLQFLLFTQKKVEIQSRFPQNIYVIFQKSNCDKLLSNICEHFLSNLVNKPNMKYSCRVFFDILVLIFDNNFVTDSLFQKVLQFIKKIRFAEISLYQEKQNSQNELISGWLRICKCLLLKSITNNLNLKFISQSPQNFADFIISNGLFGQQHRFQHERSRQQAFEILTNLQCKNYVMEKLGNQIVPIITKGFWRKQNQWFVKSFKKRQKDTKVGLKNLAATCYINSLLQQLYYIKQFSEPLLDIDTKLIEVKQNIAYEVQKIFAYLKYSNREVFTTQTLCQNFIVDGQSIDPRIQMDIDQFFHTLMDKLQNNLMKIKKQNIIDDVFKGEYSNLIVGQQCQHKSQRIQNFLSMRLDIIKKNSLTEALSEFIKGQVLQGQNAYHCQKCDKKIKAVKRVCIKSLPDVLILTLKRFQFDFDRMEKFKLNSFCEFQQELNMAPYTRQFLYEGEEKLSPDEYIYKLKGVVIHYGVSQAGHYTSYIRIQNGEWKYFDDDKISSFNLKQLGKQCFGGPDDNPYSQNSQKLKNAYLLIYERIKRNKISKINSNPPIKAEVDAENLNNKQIKIMFDSSLQNFCDNNSLSLGKTYLLYVHLVSLRSQNRVKLYKKCYENCITIFQANPQLRQWYLQQFSQNLIKQLLIFAFFEASNFVASLLVYCIGKCFNGDFMKRCMKCIDRKNMVPLSKIFVAASWNAKYFKVLAEYSFPEKIYRIIKQDKISNQAGLGKISSSRSEFGQPFQTFYEKKDTRNSIELIQCIQAFKIKGFPKQDVLPFASRTKKPAIQTSLAKFFISKIKDQQTLTNLANQFILPYLNKFQPKFQQEYMFKFAIILTNKLVENKDLQSVEKVVAEIYFISIKQNLNGYKAMRLLLQGLFSICFNNDKVREQFINILNQKDNKKYIKLIKDWMKQADKFQYNLKQDRIGYWRKLTRNPYSVLQRLQLDIKVSSQKYLSLFNSLLQKHKIDFTDIYSPSIKKGEKISIFEYLEYNYEVVDKFGLILQIKNEGGEKFVLEDDVYPQRSV